MSSTAERKSGWPGVRLDGDTRVLVAQITLLVVSLLVAGFAWLRAADPGGGAVDEDEAQESSTDRPDTEAGEAPEDDSASRPRWPRELTGPVDLDAGPGVGASSSVHLWVDYSGWHLRLRREGPATPLSGTITSDAPFNRADAVGGGQMALGDDERSLIFDLSAADEEISGIDFNPGFFASSMEVVVLGEDGSPVTVHLGRTFDEQISPLLLEKRR